jgi:hypothetical protein
MSEWRIDYNQKAESRAEDVTAISQCLHETANEIVAVSASR